MNKELSAKSLALSAIPSLIVIVISIFFDSIYQKAITNLSGSEGLILNHEIIAINLWWYPIIVYGIFCFCLYMSYSNVNNKLHGGRASKKEVVTTIGKWNGFVDGIGTALPLIGAAVILFTIGLGKENQKLFLEIAVPFEIKSLFILASAKLFESVFDDLEIQVESSMEDSIVIPKGTIEFVNLPDMNHLDEINRSMAAWKETVDNMKDPVFQKNLEMIMKITGKS